MVRACLAGDGNAPFSCLAQELHAAGRAQMLAMHVGAGLCGEQDVARHDHFLAGGRPARNPRAVLQYPSCMTPSVTRE